MVLSADGTPDPPVVLDSTGRGAPEGRSEPDDPSLAAPVLTPPSFEDLYDQEFAFVWRNLRRLGVPERSLRDAAQDVFLVVHRRLPEFQPRAPLRSWLYSIVTRVARQYRRTQARKELRDVQDADTVEGPAGAEPEQGAARGEFVRLLVQLLERLDDDKRDAVILADLEGMTVPEIAVAVGANVNTVYSRLRAARKELQAALVDYRARGAKTS